MYKILLTVDDAIAQKNFQDQLQLKLSGSEFIFTKDTQETASLLMQGGISFVVLDLNSFQVDSLYILALMTHEYPTTPCFILGDHTLLDSDNKSPLYHYHQKPYDLEEVTSDIAHVIREDILPSTPKGIPVSLFTQLISKEAKTCLLGIYPPDGNKGLFYFEKGILFDAVQSNLKGEAAAKNMLSIPGAEVRFKDIQKKIARKINTSLLAILEQAGEPFEAPPQEAPQPQPAAPATAPQAEPEPVAAAPVEEVQEVVEELPEVDLEPIGEDAEVADEEPLFSGTEEVQEAKPIADAAKETEKESLTADQEQQAEAGAEEAPVLEPIEEPVESEPTEKAEDVPSPETEEADRPKTIDYFEETKEPETPVEDTAESAEAAPPESETPLTEKPEEEPPQASQEEAVAETEMAEEQPAEEATPAEEPERPKTIDYFDETKEPEAPKEEAVEQKEPERPKTIDYEYTTEEPKPAAEQDAAPPEAQAPVEEPLSIEESPKIEKSEQEEDIVSILEAEPGEVEEDFEEMTEKADSETDQEIILEESEIVEEEEDIFEESFTEPVASEPEPPAEPIEEDLWEEPLVTSEEEPQEVVSDEVEEVAEEEEISDETMEEVVAPIETAIQEEASQADTEIETDFQTLWDNNIGDLREIRGYKAAAVLNFNGEVAVFDSVDPKIQLNTIGATFNSLFWLSQDAFNRLGLEQFNELILSTPAGLVVMISSGKESPKQFHLIGVLAEDGNQNLMRFKFGNLAQKIKKVPA